MNDSTSVRRSTDELLTRLFRNGRTNALLAWVVTTVLVLTLFESALDTDFQWTVFVAAATVVALVPPLAYRAWEVMLPWELLVVATFPILVRSLFGGTVGTFASYISVAGLALLIVVELHMFTSLNVTHWFAVTLVVLTTLASVATWTIVRWNLDRTLGTNYLTTNEALMTEWLWVSLAGIVAGVLFDAYFRRRDRQLRRALGRVLRR